MEAEFLAFRGINSIVNIISSVKEHYNEKLEILGVFFTNFNKTRILTQEIKEEVKKYFGNTLLNNVIRVNVAIAESQSNGKSVIDYDDQCNGSIDYLNLVNEILQK
jgi:chromosome partitioning protein